MFRRLFAWLFGRRRRSAIAVLGAPGSGKSTLLSQWGVANAHEYRTVPAGIDRATHVVYVINARTLCGCLGFVEGQDWAQLERDAAAIGARLRRDHRGQCVIAVTNADRDCRPRIMQGDREDIVDAARYQSYVERELAPIAQRLGAGRPVAVVTGSLTNPAAGASLVSAVASRLGSASAF